MRISLIGIYGVYNFGCEAIVRGCIKYFRNIYPDATFTYYSFRAEDDKKTLKDENISIISIINKRNLFSKVINRMSSYFKINKRCFLDYSKKIIDNSDIVISIGGDIYTIPKFKINNKKYDYYNQLIQFGDQVLKANKKLIIYGASIGPFGDFERVKKYYFNHLKKVTLIVCRENRSIEYLRNNGVESNVIFSPDPAFSLRLDSLNETKNIIGINLSGLSSYEANGDGNVFVSKLAMLIVEIIKMTDLDIMLVPHVLSPLDNKDNDFFYLSNLKKLIADDYKNRVTISNANNFFEAKNDLKKCKFVIAARMHCAINAVSECIPTIFISYSSKAIGMANYIYSSNEYTVSISDLDEQLLPKVRLIADNVGLIEDKLISKMKEIDYDYNFSIEKTKEALHVNK